MVYVRVLIFPSYFSALGKIFSQEDLDTLFYWRTGMFISETDDTELTKDFNKISFTKV